MSKDNLNLNLNLNRRKSVQALAIALAVPFIPACGGGGSHDEEEALEQASAHTLAVMQRHAQAMATRNPDTIAADYAMNTVVSTTFADSLVIGRQGIADWVRENLASFEAALASKDGSPPKMKLFTAKGEYGHLIVDLGDGRYGTETYHVRNNEVLFESATFFLNTNIHPIDQSGEQLDPVSAHTLAVMQRHVQAMATRNPDTIAADYAENTIVSTTFANDFVIGRKGIAGWVRKNLDSFEAALASKDGAPPKMVQFIAKGEYGHLIVDLGDGRHGTETYHVRNNEILFESATFFL